LPAEALAVGVVLAVPSAAIVAGLTLSGAEAPLVGAVNVTWPPATGSNDLLAVTVTTRGLAKGSVMLADCPLPEVTAMVNPLDSKAPMSTVPPTILGKPGPRWSVVRPAGMRLLSPALMAGLPGNRAMVCVGPP